MADRAPSTAERPTAERPAADRSADPYAPPRAPLETVAVRERRALLGVERDLRTLGAVIVGMGLIGLSLGLLLVGNTLVSGLGPGEDLSRGWLHLGVGLVLVKLGRDLRRLRPWTRWPAVLATVFLGVFFPVGTLVAVLVGWRLLTPSAGRVLSTTHEALREATPELSPGRSWGVVLIVLVGVLAALAIGVPGLLG